MLYRSILDIKNRLYAFLICSFVLLQPCYCFYQDNFHVCATAYNTFVLGLSYLLVYFYKDGGFKKFCLGVFLLTIAALMRFMQVIPIIALLITFLVVCIYRRTFLNEMYVLLGSILIVMGYFVYNQLLAAKYGSVFMNTPNYVTTLREAYAYVKQLLLVYPRTVIPPSHFLVIIVLVVLFIKQFKRSKLRNLFVLWLFINAFGSLLFTVIMLRNVAVHEYYSIDVWLPVLTILLIYLLFSIDLSKIKTNKLILVISILFVSGLFITSRSQFKRYNTEFSNILNGVRIRLLEHLKIVDFT